ncbi:hypothetical protein pb186bvf_002992 [Paramecium bursaria]
MNSASRRQNRPPRPPVPKFRMTGAGTDTPDFLPPPRSEDSSFALSQDNTSVESEVSTDNDQYFSKKRLQSIIEQISHYAVVLDLNNEVQKCAIHFLQPELLEQIKQKKYNAIAIAALISAIKQLSLPITLKEILAKVPVSEKQIKKILFQIKVEKSQDTIQNFLKSITKQMKLNEKFYSICEIVLKGLEKYQLIGGEHENVVAGTIIKIASDMLFSGGIVPQIIADESKCSLHSIRITQ